jgi:hypothetical protein
MAADCDGGKGGRRQRLNQIRIRVEQVLSKISGALQKYWGNLKTTNPSKPPVKKNSAK